jgi:EAL domain-containing protein (putative c-di-GMP-specific phosphodiesterase class I)/GGDEF domain-containing protein/ActR/RegA family two-component response regulator
MEKLPKQQPARTLALVTEVPAGGDEKLVEALGKAGFSIERSSLAQAPERIRGNLPDLVLVDPASNGEAALELCRTLRGGETTHGLPIVMLQADSTGTGSANWIVEACAAGATEFLDGPIDPALLERRLDSALAFVEHLLGSRLLADSDGGTMRPIAAPAVFPHLVTVAVEQCHADGKNVCVLAVRPNASAGDEQLFDEQFSNLLKRAVREFEEAGPTSHPRGHVVITRVHDALFALLVPGMERIQDAARLGYKIHECVLGASDTALRSVCIGISTSPGDGHEGLQLLEQADEAASRARQDESNCLAFRTESTNRWVFERLTLERSLRNAIEREELIVYYQPKVAIEDRSLVGFEALVRWQHPELGMISPAQFIPLAEETGLITPIGEWVLETACKQVQAWAEAGFMTPRMAVNLSPVQFRQPNLCDVVSSVLERTGMSAGQLELEVTESMLMHDLKETIKTLQRLKASGIYLSIDDFGTGYSSLSYLKGFPIDALKIDRSFVRDITANADDAAIATSIILLGHSLNLKVIAEGVETESQMAFLQVLQCNEIQGYLISPPVPAQKAETFLRRA